MFAPAAIARHIVFVTGTPASVEQGSGTYVAIATLAEALRTQGHTVEVIAPPWARVGVWRRWRFNRTLRRRELPVGATGVGIDLDGLWLPGVKVAAIKGVVADEARFERGWTRLSLVLQARWERRRVSNAARLIAPSQYAATAMERCYGVPHTRVAVVPEMLDVARWQAQVAAAPLEPRLVPRILCVARLYPRKDVATLLRAMALLRQPAELQVAGDGPERQKLEGLARVLGLCGRVYFSGHADDAARARAYRNADVFCFPSRQEAFGIVLLEAMAAGVPVVAAEAASIPEVLEGAGALFPPGDAAALAVRLDVLLADAAARRALGVRGQERVRRFEAARVAAEFLTAIGADC